MQVWFRLLIVCFIALALPVQGLASATMTHCGQSHERSRAAHSASAATAPAGNTADHHDMAAGADAAAVQAHAKSDKSDKSDRFADLAQYKCSACASCCAAAALPSVMLRVPVPAFTPVVFAQTTVTVHAYATDGPDRPPRN